MSETKEARRAARASSKPASTGGGGGGRHFATVAAGENVVMTDGSSGRSWALGTDGGHPVWQPITFRGHAEKAPRGGAKEDEE